MLLLFKAEHNQSGVRNPFTTFKFARNGVRYTAANSDFFGLIVPNIKETSHVGNPNNIFNSIFINGTYK